VINDRCEVHGRSRGTRLRHKKANKNKECDKLIPGMYVQGFVYNATGRHNSSCRYSGEEQREIWEGNREVNICIKRLEL
jgi:hypothetical protein